MFSEILFYPLAKVYVPIYQNIIQDFFVSCKCIKTISAQSQQEIFKTVQICGRVFAGEAALYGQFFACVQPARVFAALHFGKQRGVVKILFVGKIQLRAFFVHPDAFKAGFGGKSLD